MNKLYMGSFDCEKFWTNNNAILPKIIDKQADNCVLTMDELLTFIGDKEDKLLTRFKIDSAQLEYLRQLGMYKTNLAYEEISNKNIYNLNKDICTLLMESYSKEGLKFFENDILFPFSVVKNTKEVTEKYNLRGKFPDLEIVKRVNSKFFSTYVNEALGLYHKVNLVRSVEEFEFIGSRLLQISPILIKEEYGVSGKGNLLVDSQNKFKRIVKYLKKQEEQSMRIRFLIEPLLHKKIDFSTQFFIGIKGDIKFESVQVLNNQFFSYKESVRANELFIEKLIQKEYFKKLILVGKKLFEEGYFGPVCIDSMILDNKMIYEVVEINARMSMSYIKNQIDSRYKGENESYFTYFNFKLPTNFRYDDLLEELDCKKVLFHGNRGILPLSSKMMTINKINHNDKYYKGRLYVWGVGNWDLEEIMKKLDMKLL